MKKYFTVTMLLLSMVIATISIVSCKKELANLIKGTNPTTGSPSGARLNKSYSNITYDASLGMLVFPDVTTFQNTITNLTDELANFKFDNGNTDDLINDINNFGRKNNTAGQTASESDVINKLNIDSPLSEKVLMAVITSNLSVGSKQNIIENNVVFTERMDSAIQVSHMPPPIIEHIHHERIRKVPFQPVLDEFEKLFPGFTSLRKTTDNSELQFLLAGGDPIDPQNPSKKNFLGRLLSTLVNSRTEVKIGSAFYLYLPQREITITNGSRDILNYIRTNGNVPIKSPPVGEPENGFPISLAPLPVDPNIVVNPTAREVGCGPIDINAGIPESGRFAFHSSVTGTGLVYYWNFGDGFVSYKENPTHTYNDNLTHSVTVTVFNELGIDCGGGSTQTGSGSGNGTGGASCTLNASSSIQGGANLNITCNVTVYSTFTLPLSYSWDFHDGSFSTSSAVTHYFQTAGPKIVTITVTDGAGCVYTHQYNVTVTNPTPPPSPCCNKYDKSVGGALNPDDNHRFTHTLNALNFWGNGQVCAEVVTYTKIPIVNIWFWSYNSSSVSICDDATGGGYGTVYGLDQNNNGCGIPYLVKDLQGGTHIWNTLTKSIPFKPIYTDKKSVASNGFAFNSNNHLAITDCP